MVRRRLVQLLISVSLFVSTAQDVLAATITLDTFYSFVEAGASDALGSETQNFAYPSSLPASDTVNAARGGSTSSTVFSFSNAGFDFSFDHVRISTSDAYADSQVNIVFTTDTNVSYALSGLYSASDNEGRTLYFTAFLEDLTTSSSLFNIVELSQSTPNESLTLGAPDGESNSITGSLTGTLIAGNTYRFFSQAQISSYPNDATSTAQAAGNVSLSLIPEPATAFLIGLGLAGLAGCRRPGGRRTFHS